MLTSQIGRRIGSRLAGFLLAFALLALPGTASAQADPLSIMNTLKTTPTDAVKGYAAGVLQNSGIDAGTATNLVNTLSTSLTSGSLDVNGAARLFGGVLDKEISGAIGQAMAKIPGLGNLDLNQLTQGLVGQGVDKLLGGLLGNNPGAAQIQGALNQALSALNIGGNAGVQGMLQTAAAGAVAQILDKAFPELSKLLGGIPGLTNILNGLFGGGGGGGSEDPKVGGASCACESDITNHHEIIRAHMTNKRKEHEVWLVTEFFTKHVAPALMLMAEQMTAVGMQQVQIIGSFFDAKHQLETQRLLQQMTAQAHKDYQPSEGLCTFGTSVRSLAGSERAGDLAHIAIAARGMQRQLLSNENLSGANPDIGSDRNSRMKNFIENFCDKKDNMKALQAFCSSADEDKEKKEFEEACAAGDKESKAKCEEMKSDRAKKEELKNRDIDYTRSVENKLTLDLDFHTKGEANKNPSEDEMAIFALGANLYAHEVPQYIDANTLVPLSEDPRFDTEQYLMDIRALAAKRSVAQNSFAAITGMKAAGTPEAQPYLYKMVEELGVPKDDLEKLLGKNPSYFAQMEILTKQALQNPVFYTELYDKPVNVERKGATLQAIGLMQDRDIYKSLIRSEAILSVLLDTMLAREQDEVVLRIEALEKTDIGSAGGTTAGGESGGK